MPATDPEAVRDGAREPRELVHVTQGGRHARSDPQQQDAIRGIADEWCTRRRSGSRAGAVTVPINAAANICGLEVNLLSQMLATGPVTCTAGANQQFTVSQ